MKFDYSILILIFSVVVLATVSAAVSSSSSGDSSVCRAVSFSGAGDRGAYEAGVVAGLVDSRDPADLMWQFATGISAGSINAAGMAMYNIGNEVGGKDFLVNQWLGINKRDIYTDWKIGGVVDGLLFQKGIFDNTALYNFMGNVLNVTALQSSTRGLLIGATDITTGLFQRFEKNETNIVDCVVASASIPAVFPPAQFWGQTFVDGGVTYMTPISDTARLCQETGAEKIIIDVIVIGNPTLQEDCSNYTSLPILMRSASIVQHNIAMKDIETVFQAFDNVQVNLFYPSQSLPGYFLGFEYSKIMVSIGYKDGQDENNVITLTNDNYKEIISKLYYK
ncbi:patatin family protein [Cavenderia fasciculata]|uniref:Patatin family protein n=1 Tax=Cavenderia fasciculata TaxID=261658 RepID=F4PJ47_CACFS|nr:patatin family protein [Cavenderia fasciculata]EGG24333.1 patatin family protein [Cavenderia fasciculata]|eukprot:XP_004362184.1 patatin family protein [Cavenderia fasciculata]